MEKLFQEYRLGSKKNTFKNSLQRLRVGESYVSLFLGIIVVGVIVSFLVIFVGGKRTQDTSSVKTEEIPEVIAEQKQNNEQEKYTVASGDTLWSIAEKKYNAGEKWDVIAQANKITDPTVLKEGDKLDIPKNEQKMSPKYKDEQQVTSTPSANMSKPTDQQTQPVETGKIVQDSYTVVPGDTLWDIAVRAYGDGFRWHDIALANNLANPDLIFAGNVFKLPR
ncbi:MAG: hypothetical protein A3D75_00015 [Candidatus Levybacteria bacterium RIFCSPHIGHO2_02_FULL_37_18]|nr:MAG: hypothetical protein A3D75_00015 [Candidatus Levybacteria bacterium RIFCSPHIGHO2_02_FULL_37_18]